MRRAFARSAFSCRQASNRKLPDLTAKTGVQAIWPPNIVMRTDQGAEPMNLMISETALRLSPAATCDHVAIDILSYATGDAPCQVLVARSTKGVCAILLG